MSSLLGTGKLNGIDSETYLPHILSVLPGWNKVDELLLWGIVALAGLLSVQHSLSVYDYSANYLYLVLMAFYPVFHDETVFH